MTEYYCYDAPDGHHKTSIRNTAKKLYFSGYLPEG